MINLNLNQFLDKNLDPHHWGNMNLDETQDDEELMTALIVRFHRPVDQKFDQIERLLALTKP